MDIGLEVLNRGKVTAVPSMEQMFDQYVSCEKLIADTNRFSDYGDQLFTAFDNVMSLGRVAAKYNSTESLAVLNSLVGKEFGGSFEAEEVKGAAKSIWQKIGEFFAKIWEWIKTFFYRILNFFGGADKRLAKMEADYKALKGDCQPWKFKGINFLNAGSKENAKVEKSLAILDKLTDEAHVNEQKSVIFQRMEKAMADVEVKDKSAALTVIGECRGALAESKSVKAAAEAEYNNAKQAVKRAEGEQNIKAAKLAQKKAAATVAITNRGISILMRTVASVMANGKCREKKAEKAK